jgi:hypothetical protein
MQIVNHKKKKLMQIVVHKIAMSYTLEFSSRSLSFNT